MSRRIGGLILAAGLSSRMGDFRPLMPLRGKVLIENTIDSLLLCGAAPNVEVLASNGEIGQGLRTTFPKIVAHELNLPLEKVFYDHPDTSRVPDSGPTVASRSLMTVGELLRRAAIKLRTQWKDGEDQIVEEKLKLERYELTRELISTSKKTGGLPHLQALSVTFGDSSPGGRARTVKKGLSPFLTS